MRRLPACWSPALQAMVAVGSGPGDPLGPLRDRAPAGRADARHHPVVAAVLPLSTGQLRSSCFTRWFRVLSLSLVRVALRATAQPSGSSGILVLGAGARAERIELAARARRRLRGGRLRRHERRRTGVATSVNRDAIAHCPYLLARGAGSGARARAAQLPLNISSDQDHRGRGPRFELSGRGTGGRPTASILPG